MKKPPILFSIYLPLCPQLTGASESLGAMLGYFCVQHDSTFILRSSPLGLTGFL